MANNREVKGYWNRVSYKKSIKGKKNLNDDNEDEDNRWQCTVLPLPSPLSMPDFKFPKDLLKVLEGQLKETVSMTEISKNYLVTIQRLPKIKLDEQNYFVLLKLCLYLEEYTECMDTQKNNMMSQTITRSDKFRTFNVPIPHLDEDDMFIKVDDQVELHGDKIKNRCYAKVQHIGRRYIQVCVPKKFADAFKPDDKYHIKFVYTNWCERCCHYALHFALKYSLNSTIFPTAKTYNEQAHPPSNLIWFNKNVEANPEQQQAIINMISKTAYPAPYILFGPPGTGKTSTLVEAICQIWYQDSSNRVLVCTPSNAAADEITGRLLNHIPANHILRMYGLSRQLSDVKEKLEPCTNFVDDKPIFLPREILDIKKVVITTLISCTRLMALYLYSDYFEYVFIDEASQTTEPEVLIPMNLMHNKKKNGNLQGQVILAGDPWQLGPVIKSTFAKNVLGKSMLERLLKCDLYKMDDKQNFNPKYLTQLVKNFRNHCHILYVSNKQFYANKLQSCGGAHTEKALYWSELPNPIFPLIFHAVYGVEEKTSISTSSFNEKEISVVIKYLEMIIGKSLSKHCTEVIQPKDVGIVTPFKLQQQKIEKELRKRKWNDLTVGTVESFQGQEREIIILTTVRSQVLEHNDVKHIGFLSSAKRFNVAVTRAKCLLIIIGNPKVLKIAPCWRRLIRHCEINGAFRTDFKKKDQSS